MTRPLRSTDPTRIGDYELTGRIGGGGMGDVFLGRSPSGRLAAVKVVRDLLADDPRFRERFRREVAAARSVSGAYTAAVLDADPDAERPWLATAYIDGPSLLERVRDEGPLDAREARSLGAGLSEALRDIHRAGLVHRDLKPGNVLLAADGPRLIDFGIIRAEDGEGLTETGYVLGSAGYMAPEQAAGGEATTAADVYSLGAVLTFAATGHGPFGDGPTPSVLLRQASGDKDISAVPEGLRAVVSRCLDVLPGARPTTDSLLELLGENAIAISQAPSPKDKKKPVRTNKPRRKTRTKTPELDELDALLRATSSNTQNAEIAVTPTTLMRAGKNSEKADKTKKTKNTKPNRRQPSQPTPTRRKFLFLGVAGAAVAAFGVGVAAMPHGDAKTTGAENTDTEPTAIPTTKAAGMLGGPMKSPLWSEPTDRVDLLALSGNTLLVHGTTVSAFDKVTGGQRWRAPVETYAQANDAVIATLGDTVFEVTATGTDLVAVTVAGGTGIWNVPGPVSWIARGLLGASTDLVIGWSDIGNSSPGSDGMWAVDPQSRHLRWSTPITVGNDTPYFSDGAGLILVSQPNKGILVAYSAQTGHQAWTAQDTSPASDSANATGVTSHGKTIYWGTNRLYAFDQNGHAVWPVGVADGDGGGFHAVIADDTAVYAAATGSPIENVIAAYKATDGAPLWRASWPKIYGVPPALECELALGGGNLYIADYVTGTLIAVNAKTGETQWQFHDPAGAGGNFKWKIAADDQYVFVGYGSTVRGFKAA